MERKYHLNGVVELTMVVEPSDGQFAAHCVEMGTASCGDTVQEALHNICEAVEIHLEGLAELGHLSRMFRERGITVVQHNGQPPSARLQLPVEVPASA